MTDTCAICTRHPHADTDDCTSACRTRPATLGVTCEPCAQRIRDNLTEIVDLYALTASPDFPTSGTGPGGKTAPLPGGTEWMSWRQAADLIGPSGILSTWARDWMDIYGLAGPKGGTLTQVTGWLTAHLSSACNSHPAITDFAHEIADLARMARRIRRRPSTVGWRLQVCDQTGSQACEGVGGMTEPCTNLHNSHICSLWFGHDYFCLCQCGVSWDAVPEVES